MTSFPDPITRAIEGGRNLTLAIARYHRRKGSPDRLRLANIMEGIVSDARARDGSDPAPPPSPAISLPVPTDPTRNAARVRFRAALQDVSRAFAVKPEDILNHNRHADVIDARFALWLMCSQQCGLSLAEIGRNSDRDHTTVRSGILAAQALMDRSQDFRERFAKAERGR